MPTQVRDFKGERVPHPFTLSLEGLALPALSLEGRIEGS
jgi:hypothetical protein